MAIILEQLAILDKTSITYLQRLIDEDIPTRNIIKTPINILNLSKFKLHN